MEHDEVCTAHTEGDPIPGYRTDKEQVLRRLAQIEGQVRGVRNMVESDRYCIDVLTQVSAINSALRSVSLLLFDDHLAHCVAKAANSGPDALDPALDEVRQVMARLVR